MRDLQMDECAAVVLVVDRLGTGFLGPFGNTWIESPALNRLASQSWLCQNAYGYPLLSQAYDALWAAPWESLNARWQTRLFADDAEVLDHRRSAEFAEQSCWHLDRPSELASRWEETLAALFFAQMAMDMAELPQNTVSWYHFSGLRSAWGGGRAACRPEFRFRPRP